MSLEQGENVPNLPQRQNFKGKKNIFKRLQKNYTTRGATGLHEGLTIDTTLREFLCHVSIALYSYFMGYTIPALRVIGQCQDL
jgi:hypothetical protein